MKSFFKAILIPLGTYAVLRGGEAVASAVAKRHSRKKRESEQSSEN